MNKKIKGVFVLISTIALVLVIAIFAGWLYYTEKNKQTKTKTGLTINLKDDKPYPKVETYNIPVLMYHYVRDASGEDEVGQKLSVSPQNFEAHLAWLKENDFKTLSLSDLADSDRTMLSKINGEGYRPIVITFDDGYDNAYTQAFPLLKKYDFTGTFFIIRNFVDRAEYMNQSQIDALAKAGMEIGSHTLTHPDLTDLDSGQALAQITQSKLDSEVFCYPSGRYNDRIKDLVKDAGYVAAVTTKSGLVTQESRLFDLPRIRINDISGEAFGSIIDHALENE